MPEIAVDKRASLAPRLAGRPLQPATLADQAVKSRQN